MAELKLCPFCGGMPTLHKDTWEVPNGKAVAWWVKCRTCGTCSDEYKTAKNAEDAWNRRVNDHGNEER